MNFPEPPEFSDNSGAHRFLEGICALPEGITNIAYLGLSLPGRVLEEPVVISTYDQDWVTHYIDQQYAKIDPAIINGLRGILPYDWNSKPHENLRVRNFFGEASEFGVSPNGLSIPIRGSQGERAVFSINSELPTDEWEHMKSTSLGDLTVLAYLFHTRVLDTLNNGVMHDEVQLSKREREVLAWAAEGKSAWETANILSISENSVKFYLRNAAIKFRTTNKLHAVVSAIRLGLLS